jgi:uncharacterized protein
MQLDRNGLEILDRVECLRLLESATLGRIGFSSGALPSVLPVNFHLDHNLILVRTTRGSRLDAALRDAVVAFEADELDPVDHSGWSVAVTGVATEIDPGTLDGAHRDPAAAVWAPTGHEALLAISIDLISGRRSTTQAPWLTAERPATP